MKMATEEKDPVLNGNSDSSPQPEGEGKDASSPTNASGGKEDRASELEAKYKELSERYSQSSAEAKRLKQEADELKAREQEREEYIAALEKLVESSEEKVSEESGEEGNKEEKVEESEKETSTKPKAEKPLRESFFLSKEEQRKLIREEIKRDKEEEAEAERRYKEAVAKNPKLKNRGYSKLVSAKMKLLDTADIEEACKEVDKDLARLKEEEKEEEPFVEGGKGKSSPQPENTVEDEIRKSLKRGQIPSGLQGLV